MTITDTGVWANRVAGGDWDAIIEEMNDVGGALLPQLLAPTECARIRALFDDPGLFRSTIYMTRYRFGRGGYRYFARPYPQPIDELEHARYPRLLPIARDWWTKLRRDPPWLDTLDDWLGKCHDAGQTKSTAILSKYVSGDWNALHRDLYGELVFPLQVVINLNDPEVDHTGGEFLLVEQRPRAQSRGSSARFRTATATCSPPGTGRFAPPEAGRPVRSGTACRPSGRVNATPWHWSATTPHELRGAGRGRVHPARRCAQTVSVGNPGPSGTRAAGSRSARLPGRPAGDLVRRPCAVRLPIKYQEGKAQRDRCTT